MPSTGRAPSARTGSPRVPVRGAAPRSSPPRSSRAGLRVVARNWRQPEGELDIVVDDAGTCVFVEVRSRTGTALGDPLESITPHKQAQVDPDRAPLPRRGVAAAASGYRFDVVGVTFDPEEPADPVVSRAERLRGRLTGCKKMLGPVDLAGGRSSFHQKGDSAMRFLSIYTHEPMPPRSRRPSTMAKMGALIEEGLKAGSARSPPRGFSRARSGGFRVTSTTRRGDGHSTARSPRRRRSSGATPSSRRPWREAVLATHRDVPGGRRRRRHLRDPPGSTRRRRPSRVRARPPTGGARARRGRSPAFARARR